MFTCWVQHRWVTELNCSLQYFVSPLFIFVSLKYHIDNTANIPCSYFFPQNWKMQLPPVHKLFFCSCIQTITLHAGIRWQWQKQQWWYCFYFFFIETEMWHHSHWGKWKTIFTNMMKKKCVFKLFNMFNRPEQVCPLVNQTDMFLEAEGVILALHSNCATTGYSSFSGNLSLTITWMQRAAIHLHFRDNGALL